MQSSCYHHETGEAARLAGPRVPPKLPPKVSRRLTERPGASTGESAAAKAKKAPPLPAQRPRSTSVVPCTSREKPQSQSQQPPHHQVQQSASLLSLSPPPPAPIYPKGTQKLNSPGLIPHELPARPSDPGTPRLGSSRRRRGMMPPPPLVSSPNPPTSTSALTPRSSLPGNTSRLSSPQDSENHAPASKAVESMPILQLPARPLTRPERGPLSMTGKLNISHDAGLVIETNSKASFRPGASSLPPTPRAGIMTPIVRSPQARELGGSFSTSSASSTFSLESHPPANGHGKANEISMPNASSGPGRAQVEKKTLVRARVSYDSSLPGHLSFEAGQIIELLQQEDDLHDDDGHALWKGRAIIGGREHVGIFPSVHVALMKSRLNSLGNADFAAAGLPSKKELRMLNKDCISPENLERETRCDKLFRAIEEVIETELRHVSDLSIVLEVFIMPFQDTFGPLLARQVFSDWAPLLRVHEQVLVNLMATLPSLEQLAKGFESVGNDPNVQLALRDDTNQGPAKQPRGARVGLAPSNLAAFAEGVNQAARLGVARKPLGADSGTPSASIKSTAQQRGKDFLSAKDMNAMKERLAFLSKLRREHLADFLYLDDAQVTRWTLILHEMTISVCRVMTEMSDWLKLCIPCVVNQPVAMKTLLRSKGGNGATVSPKMFIQLQAHQERERLKHLDLASFLIKPMQRITKYPLLMREIRKYCEADSKAQSDASDATETMTRIATNVNDIMKQHQNLDYSKRLIEICTQLRPRETVERLGLGADSRGRRLYRFGRVTFQTLTTSMNSSQLTHEDDSHLPAAQLSKTEEIRHGSCYAMLFTSALLLSLKALNKWKTKTKFHIVKVVELGHIVSVESMDGCLAVRTACSLLLITPLEGDVLEWLVDMQECRRVAAADRERQDVVNAQRKKRQGSSGRAMTRRTRSEDLSKLVRGPLQSLRGAPSRELTKAERDNIICELKTHAKFSTAS